jgi:hypothetical protein
MYVDEPGGCMSSSAHRYNSTTGRLGTAANESSHSRRIDPSPEKQKGWPKSKATRRYSFTDTDGDRGYVQMKPGSTWNEQSITCDERTVTRDEQNITRDERNLTQPRQRLFRRPFVERTSRRRRCVAGGSGLVAQLWWLSSGGSALVAQLWWLSSGGSDL